MPRGLNPSEAATWVREHIKYGGISLLTKAQHEYSQSGFAGASHVDFFTNPRQAALTYPITIDVLKNSIAPLATLYLNLRGDGYRTLRGTDLTNEIGQALNLAVEQAPSSEQSVISLYTSEAALDAIEPVAKVIRQLSGEQSPKVAIVPVFIRQGDDMGQVPLFRVDTVDGVRFVDHIGRVYTSFEHWQQKYLTCHGYLCACEWSLDCW